MGKGLLPSCWGPIMWGSLHSIAYAYNPQTDKDNYFNFFSNLGTVLPCEECRTHYYQNLNKQDLVVALISNENLFKWVYDLHNKVNFQTGIPESKWPSYESIKERYASFEASCSNIQGVCGSTPGKKQKKIKMVEQFGEVNEDQLPFIVSTAVLAVLLSIALLYIIITRKNHKQLLNR